MGFGILWVCICGFGWIWGWFGRVLGFGFWVVWVVGFGIVFGIVLMLCFECEVGLGRLVAL